MKRHYFAWVEQENLIREACDALRLAEQDSVLPPPSDHAEILRRDDVREALAKGAYLIQVPLIEIGTEVVRANITLERAMLDAIDFAAKGRGMTRSAFLVNAARHEIET